MGAVACRYRSVNVVALPHVVLPGPWSMVTICPTTEYERCGAGASRHASPDRRRLLSRWEHVHAEGMANDSVVTLPLLVAVKTQANEFVLPAAQSARQA